MTKPNSSAPTGVPDMHPKEAIQRIRSRVLQTSLLISGIVGIPTVIFVFFRSAQFGWRNVNLFYLGAVVLAWLFVLLGDKIPLAVRAITTLTVLFLVGASTLYSVGLSSMALVWLILFCLLGIIFMNLRTGIIALGISLTTITAVGMGIHFGYISFDTIQPAFFSSRSTWIITILSFGLVGTIIASVLGGLQRFLINSIFRLDNQRQEMQTANESLRASEEHFRTLIETSPVAMVVGDGTEDLLHVNKKFVEILGYTVKDIPTQQRWTELAYPDEAYRKKMALAWKTNIEKAIANNTEIEPVEAVITSKKGDQRTIEFRASRIGEKTVLTCTDVTARRAHENELQRLRNLLGSIIDSMESIIIGVDRDILVTQWNKQAASATGTSAEQALTKPLGEVFPRIATEVDWVKRAIQSGKRTFQLKVPVPMEKEIRYWDVTTYPIIEEQVEGAVIRIDDVTDRVRLEERIIQSEKMMSVGQLAAGMAHEINNPLAGVLQNAQLLKTRLTTNLPKNLAAAEEVGISMDDIVRFGKKRSIPRTIDQLADAGTRAAKIVENMLSFVRRSESVKVPRDIRVLLDATIELCRTDYDFKRQYDFLNIEIKKEYDSNVAFVPCEATEIQQVFFNLLKNGAEAMNLVGTSTPPPADAPASTRKKPTFILRIKRHKEMVRVEIEDNGPGMDQDTRKRIFEPFFTSKEVGEGTGLGLSVSYFIITNNHNGHLTVDSIEGRGTTFIIDLPIQ